MISNEKFGIIGGDLRQIYLAKKLQKDKNEVFVCGFENFVDFDKLKLKSLKMSDLISSSKYIILPVPASRNKKVINAPFSNSDIVLSEKLFSNLKNKVVFAGIVSSLIEDVKPSGLYIRDYYQREDFLIPNALLTAEGAVSIALKEYGKSIFSSRCLVVGFGRIGKILAKLLKNMGAKVTVSARSVKDISLAKISGFETTNVSKINEKADFDLIFNTVPALVLDAAVLSFLSSARMIIDLASAPGGTDKFAAEELGIKLIPALGIPGKCFPEAAGEIIADVIYKMIEEEFS
mgnify:FL=1